MRLSGELKVCGTNLFLQPLLLCRVLSGTILNSESPPVPVPRRAASGRCPRRCRALRKRCSGCSACPSGRCRGHSRKRRCPRYSACPSGSATTATAAGTWTRAPGRPTPSGTATGAGSPAAAASCGPGTAAVAATAAKKRSLPARRARRTSRGRTWPLAFEAESNRTRPRPRI